MYILIYGYVMMLTAVVETNSRTTPFPRINGSVISKVVPASVVNHYWEILDESYAFIVVLQAVKE